ncbi:AAA family ATPase [Pseudonocardia sp. WMMC193]|uniref:bifunctional aminoglycoside phosphotransferase/ATP-binding protein n=1 Tax=Pseudonocardia sp. WMMC193 TaxID=2911965 RepID=UPI001F431973|nr:AAA family ATPase [Pseudonocardia sp. WMMC193]MCF7548631.1 AAA family ATPase [Pseudonocardia sp. WMMC193]
MTTPLSTVSALRETHVGLVVLTGDRALKTKKPVRTAFCDFSTPALRRAAIAREHLLNSRLAPDVYLGTAELTGAGCAEPVLVMRRMPEDARLSTLVRRGADLTEPLREVARRMAAFHTTAERAPAITSEGSREALLGRWHRSLDELGSFRDAPLPGGDLDRVRDLVDRFLRGRGPLFARRAAESRIVDGHGDLLADDVFCLADGPRLLDCLDFDDRLRFVDALDDLCFLAMDLEHLGAPEAADLLLDDYCEFSADPAPTALRHHYVAYRAMVRAKVDCLRLAQTADPADAEAARAHLALALDHLGRGEPRLALVGGLPGTGKSTVAGDLTDLTGAVLLSSDRVRKEQAGMTPTEPAGAPFGCGLYDAEHTAALYTELLDRAELLLGQGESVVLDASWTDAHWRERAAEVAARTSSRLLQFVCTAPVEQLGRRILTRRHPVSDATPAIALAMAEAAAPWPDAVEISTTELPSVCAARAHRVWDAR